MRILAMILAGGQGERLKPLTNDRAKPAVPFGGRYRIIDFVLSNFVNSKIVRIKVLTQFKSDSLNRHLSRAWQIAPQFGYFIDPVPAQMRTGGDWYRGTADAIYQNLNLIRDEDPECVCVFGGDHIYRMDVWQMLDFHRAKNSDLTIAAIPQPLELARQYGVIEVDENWRITGFQEKPENPTPMPGRPDMALVSMGNYIFQRDQLEAWVTEDAALNTDHDFGKNIIPGKYRDHGIYAYDFSRNTIPGMEDKERGYWHDVGTIEEYYKASMELVEITPIINLYNELWPVRSHSGNYPPAKFVFADEATQRIGTATDSLISEGCIISGGRVNRCIVSSGVRVNSYSYVEESILMGDVNIGRHCKIRRAIIDKYVQVSEGTQIGYDIEEDRKRFHVTESGIVVISKDARF
jgi:glucose-1-phosphate adenylyltransferase